MDMEEDWDAEIAGTAVPTKQFQAVTVNQNDDSPSSKYFDDGYRENEQNEEIGFGSHVNFGGGQGRGRGRGRGFGRGRATNSNWREQNNSGFGGNRSQTPRTDFGSQNGFGGGNRNGFRNQNNTNRDFGSDGSLLKINILSEYVGKVIGKGGAKIKEIQAESGARVKILQDSSSPYETEVELSGSSEQQQKAKQMIEDLTIPAGDFNRWAERENRKAEVQETGKPQKIDWDMLKNNAAAFERERWADCPEIKKNFYRENKQISCMDPLEVADIRMKKNQITLKDLSDLKRPLPNPVLTFEDAFEDFPEILKTIKDNKFTEPSPIQCQAWPVLLSGMDCIGIAQTGTGKTLAFLLPAFIHIDEQITPRNKRGGPSCLVLSPTRELAQQIEMEVKKFSYRGIRSICIYGGGDRREQINLLRKGVEIVIGTPGRLNDLLMNKFYDVKSVTYLILDEADRMLDMGFEPEIKKILLDIRPDRQTVMTSATWPPEVQRMADQYLRDPVRVNVGSLDLQAVHSVTQLIEFIETQDKQARLHEFVESMGPEDKLIVFVGRKVTADDISSNFAMYGKVDFGIQSIHGDRDQLDREQALEDMKTGEARVLIATDVASRGLDIKDLTHVLNYDFPRHIEDYVHRIGRTGRAGRSGVALTFVTREDWMHVGKMIPILEEAGQEVPDELLEMAERAQKNRDRRDEERNMASRGGGGGSSRGRGCFKCGKEGHISRECPENGGFGGRGGGRGGGFRGGGGGRRDKRGGGIRVGGTDFV